MLYEVITRFYVYHNITQEIEDKIIAEMAATFTGSGFKIQNVIEELLMSQHFYDANAGLDDNNFGGIVLTSYSIHYTKLYENASARLYVICP